MLSSFLNSKLVIKCKEDQLKIFKNFLERNYVDFKNYLAWNAFIDRNKEVCFQYRDKLYVGTPNHYKDKGMTIITLNKFLENRAVNFDLEGFLNSAFVLTCYNRTDLENFINYLIFKKLLDKKDAENILKNTINYKDVGFKYHIDLGYSFVDYYSNLRKFDYSEFVFENQIIKIKTNSEKPTVRILNWE